ncbi:MULTISPECIES: CatB-related O-acetyltransferase [Rhizobium]|uniref:CatB-related O-acetyltransferase n=1 Tax=Rhizobium tumorigenes TaxID=2041385 RepID=A0AAF1KE58_9HYPH|nr:MULTISPECIES: CatB-related O-acetyltransferase [Rhizobium]MBO9101995.1 CatB-related O-acetyltransferase [Rhizobium sp. L58/93]MBO9172188.1 CatB-related O-acetyltransferase [Rhizobium sp. L245/93]MBO9187926.1 CatB-related O-acetyltransferase [Rhizobium sp. E27B/91]QXZ87822.1 CatB-related O-acetyltransferase [Rhizobium sp. K1/93]QXZ93862.1 CatB-related O-acetyltransferase [Rhizobium sp. K15/93]
MSLLDADAIHPITLPDGRVYSDTVYLRNVIDHPRIEVGNFSYFTHSGKPEETAQILAPYLGHACRERLVIGKFVQIARGSYCITSSANHPMTGFTTYPFRVFKPETFGYKDLPVRDTVVGHDVWIGHDAAIMPGVSIGAGAIVAASSVVTRDVPPYAMVGGNPAAVIKMRYPADVISDLLEIAWWDWPIEKIEVNLTSLSNGDLAALKIA